MPRSSSTSRRRRSSREQFFAGPQSEPTPWLVVATDLGLLTALWLVPLCLGGRLAIGQGILIGAAVWSAACWSLHQVFSPDSRWVWTRSEWLWLAAAGLAVLQFTPLPDDWLNWLSPHHAEVLTEWTPTPDSSVMSQRWSTLSLVPQETRSSLATLVAYGMLFCITAQRCCKQRDIERYLKWIVLVTLAVALLSLAQYGFGNGKYYGQFQYPFSNPTSIPLGPFTNRNHLAQFLALGVGPLCWWWLTASQKNASASDTGSSFQAPPLGSAQVATVHLLAMGALGIVVLAVLLTQSRGGALALGVATAVGLWGLRRSNLVSPQSALGLLAAMFVVAGVGWLAGGEGLANRIDVSSNSQPRWLIWQANLDIVKHFPWFGTGVGTHIHSYQLFLDRPYNGKEFSHADSSYLQVASENGLIGACLAAAMLMTCAGWNLGVLRRNRDATSTAIAAAISASLSANAAHAAFDYLWYVPGLVMPPLMLAACSCRLSQLDLAAEGRPVPQLPLPRLCWALAACGLVLLSPWLWMQKVDAIAAEPHRLRYLNLVFVPEQVFPMDDEPETQQALLREKAISATRAGRANPHDGQVQLSAAMAYKQMFDLLQERSENPMTLAQLRDAVQASEFSSTEELREWFDRAAGRNVRLLDAAWNCAVRSIEETPLEGNAYLCLAELCFLHDPSGKLHERLIKQALVVRPYDPNVLFAAGQEALLLGREEEGLALWKRAFGYAPLFQQRIADILATEKSAEFLCETFSPDWQGKLRMCDSFRAAGRQEELEKMLHLSAEAAAEFARRQTIEAAAAQGWIAARTAWMELHEPERAIAGLREGVRQHPHSVTLRTALGMDLFHQERYAEAAEHLRWAAGRNPDNAALQSAAKQALRASLKAQPAAPHISPATFER